MSVIERIFHSVLFEVIALAILLTHAKYVVSTETQVVAGLLLTVSLIAMTWNYIYNRAFDAIFGMDRNHRSLILRIMHGIGFELGMVAVSVPLIMWVLNLTFWKVLILDIALVIFFLVYAIVYNWCYDWVRVRLIGEYVS